MLKQFAMDWKLNRSSFFVLLAIQLGAFLFGAVLVFAIMKLDSDPGAWFCMGTLMAAIALAGITLLCYGFGYAQEFNVALSMGRTRAAFMGAYALRTVLQLLAGYVLLLGLYRLELAVYPLLFAPYGNEVAFTFLTDWRYLLPIFVGLVIVSLFMGAMYGRYGKKGLWFFYFLWIFCCFILPRMFHKEPNGGALDQMAFGLMGVIRLVPVGAWIGFGVVLAVGMILATVKLGMEQMVK